MIFTTMKFLAMILITVVLSLALAHGPDGIAGSLGIFHRHRRRIRLCEFRGHTVALLLKNRT